MCRDMQGVDRRQTARHTFPSPATSPDITWPSEPGLKLGLNGPRDTENTIPERPLAMMPQSIV